ncbi:RNA-directed DNA polymerase from mobile element jockey, partial [Stegodyphus mimosarum]
MTIVKKLKARKAPGFDGISNQALKMLPKNYLVLICNIINSCLRKNYFPQQWKHAHIVTFLKPGKNPKDVNSYR